MISPALGGYLIHALGMAGSFLANAVSFSNAGGARRFAGAWLEAAFAFSVYWRFKQWWKLRSLDACENWVALGK